MRLPDPVAQDYRFGIGVAGGGGVETPAQQRGHPQDREYLRRHSEPAEPHRIAGADQVDRGPGVGSPVLEGLGAGYGVPVAGGRHLVHAAPAYPLPGAFAQADQVPVPGEGERSEQHVVGDGERCDVGPDSKSRHQDHRQGEPPRPAQRPVRVPEVLKQNGPVGQECVGNRIGYCPRQGGDPAPVPEGIFEGLDQLAPVFRAERRGIEPQQDTVEGKHGGLPGPGG